MTGKLTIGGEDAEWVMFSRTPPGGQPVFIRSRTHQPDVRDFAAKNFFARVRCTLPPEELTENGLPKSTDALDAFEDALLAALTAANAQTYLIGVVTGQGVRDLFFSAAEGAELSAAVKSIEAERPFTAALAKGDPAPFLAILTLSPADRAKATYHGIPAQGGSGVLGKLFGR
jgi:hypothetical protein